jgi:putative ABC transport system permease protein
VGIYFTIALRNLLQARRRSLFLSIAMAIVTALLVLLNSLSQGVSNNLVTSATTLSAGHINVAGFHKTTPGDSSPIVTNKEPLRKLLLEKTPHLDYLIDRSRGWGKIVSETGSIQTGINGIDAAQEQTLFDTLQLAYEDDYAEGGRHEIIGDPGQLAERGSIMLFASQAERLGVLVGDSITIRAENPGGRTNTVDLVVVAVMRDMGIMSSFSVFVPTADLLELYQLAESTTGSYMLYLDDIEQAKPVMAKLRTILSEAGYELMDYRPDPFFFKFEQVASEDWIGQRIDLTTWEDEVSFLTWILTALDTVSFSLIAILFAIIAIGIANTLMISVRERTREIGTSRAIGMSRKAVLTMFMFEALILALFATTLGAVVGAGLAIGIDAAEIAVPIDAMRAILLSDILRLSVDYQQTLTSVLILTAFAGFSALWPALRAARMQPVEALQSIE